MTAASTAAATPAISKEEHARLSDIVRSMHQRLEEDAARLSTSSDSSALNPIERWKAVWSTVGQDEAAQYADAMNKLFNLCWEGTTYVVDVIEEHFRGKVVVDGASGQQRRGICTRGAAFVKNARRAYFQTHGVVMPPHELDELVSRGNALFAQETLRVLDVGSCHGGLMRHSPPWMMTTALDLQPAVPEVLQADWLEVAIIEDSAELTDIAETVGGPSSRLLKSIRAASFDVVVMCYMLSFLPSPQLRWEACKRAHAVLAVGGLLLILEPRRGAHSKGWHLAWGKLLPAIGFELLRTQVLAKSVSLVFTKSASPSTAVEPSPAGGLAF